MRSTAANISDPEAAGASAAPALETWISAAMIEARASLPKRPIPGRLTRKLSRLAWRRITAFLGRCPSPVKAPRFAEDPRVKCGAHGFVERGAAPGEKMRFRERQLRRQHAHQSAEVQCARRHGMLYQRETLAFDCRIDGRARQRKNQVFMQIRGIDAGGGKPIAPRRQSHIFMAPVDPQQG